MKKSCWRHRDLGIIDLTRQMRGLDCMLPCQCGLRSHGCSEVGRELYHERARLCHELAEVAKVASRFLAGSIFLREPMRRELQRPR
jgi:hypothetical protein